MRAYLSRTFIALRNPQYRIYAVGQAISVPGTWMQKVCQALLVLQLTDSGVLLGVATALQQLPTLLLTAWAGGLADRKNKRKLLIATQGMSSGPALILGTLCVTHTATIGVVLTLAGVVGCIDAIDKPARHTLVNDLVEKRDVVNAVTLNNITQNMGKVIGPAFAGIITGLFGLGAGFYANAVSFGAVVIALLFIRPRYCDTRIAINHPKSRILDGFHYVRSRPELWGVIVLMTISGLLAYNWVVVLPLLARETFNASASGVGLTFTAMGLGAVIGGLAIAGMLRTTRGSLVSWTFGLSASLMLVAVSPTLDAACVALFILGMSSVCFRTVANSTLQLRSDAAMRGRVISLFVLAANGTTPLGAPLVGWICEVFGVRVDLVIAAASSALAAIWAARYMRRAVEAPPQPIISG